jgi:Na+(H+)/acetate symporter ActP
MQRSLQIRFGIFILLFVVMVVALKFDLVPGMDNALFVAIQSYWVIMLSWLIMTMAFFMRLFFNAMRRF